VLNVRDVTDRVELAEQLRHAAFHDSLTQLPNRALFVDRVSQMLSTLERTGGLGAVLFIDLDDFKDVNDTLGHAAGDRLLSTVADRLRGCVRAGDTVARLGGDEFGVLLPTLDDDTEAEVIIGRIQLALAAAVALPPDTQAQAPAPAAGAGADRQLTPAACVGLALTRLPQTPDELLRDADLAMHRVKRTRKAHIG
jgi:diguanylate cyclase (GGDEF)-like protein